MPRPKSSSANWHPASCSARMNFRAAVMFEMAFVSVISKQTTPAGISKCLSCWRTNSTKLSSPNVWPDRLMLHFIAGRRAGSASTSFSFMNAFLTTYHQKDQDGRRHDIERGEDRLDRARTFAENRRERVRPIRQLGIEIVEVGGKILQRIRPVQQTGFHLGVDRVAEHRELQQHPIGRLPLRNRGLEIADLLEIAE